MGCLEVDGTFLKDYQNLDDLDLLMKKAEDLSRKTGWAVVKIPADPVLLPKTIAWMESLQQKGITLVPLSHLIQSNGQQNAKE